MLLKPAKISASLALIFVGIILVIGIFSLIPKINPISSATAPLISTTGSTTAEIQDVKGITLSLQSQQQGNTQILTLECKAILFDNTEKPCENEKTSIGLITLFNANNQNEVNYITEENWNQQSSYNPDTQIWTIQINKEKYQQDTIQVSATYTTNTGRITSGTVKKL